MTYELCCAWWIDETGSASQELADLLVYGWEPFAIDPPDASGDRRVWLRQLRRDAAPDEMP